MNRNQSKGSSHSNKTHSEYHHDNSHNQYNNRTAVNANANAQPALTILELKAITSQRILLQQQQRNKHAEIPNVAAAVSPQIRGFAPIENDFVVPNITANSSTYSRLNNGGIVHSTNNHNIHHHPSPASTPTQGNHVSKQRTEVAPYTDRYTASKPTSNRNKPVQSSVIGDHISAGHISVEQIKEITRQRLAGQYANNNISSGSSVDGMSISSKRSSNNGSFLTDKDSDLSISTKSYSSYNGSNDHMHDTSSTNSFLSSSGGSISSYRSSSKSSTPSGDASPFNIEQHQLLQQQHMQSTSPSSQFIGVATAGGTSSRMLSNNDMFNVFTKVSPFVSSNSSSNGSNIDSFSADATAAATTTSLLGMSSSSLAQYLHDSTHEVYHHNLINSGSYDYSNSVSSSISLDSSGINDGSLPVPVPTVIDLNDLKEFVESPVSSKRNTDLNLLAQEMAEKVLDISNHSVCSDDQ